MDVRITSRKRSEWIRRSGLSFVLPALLFAAGCGGIKTVPVNGVATFKGAPLTKGGITFVPVSDKCLPGTAEIGADGSFRAATAGAGNGLMEGEYRVAVISYSVDPINTPPSQLSKMKDGGLAIPKKYTDANTSGIKITASAGNPNIKLDLLPEIR